MNIDRELAVYKLFTILLVKVLKLSCNENKLFQVANMIVCQNVLTEMPKATVILFVLPLFAFFVIHVPENVVVIAFYSIAISIKHMSITSNFNFVSETQYLKKLKPCTNECMKMNICVKSSIPIDLNSPSICKLGSNTLIHLYDVVNYPNLTK